MKRGKGAKKGSKREKKDSKVWEFRRREFSLEKKPLSSLSKKGKKAWKEVERQDQKKG